MDTRQRAVLLGLAALTIVVAVVLGITGGGSQDEPIIDTRTQAAQATMPSGATTQTTKAPRPRPGPDTTIVFRDGEPVEGIEKLRFRRGSTIGFTVRSDVADNVHLHGYDVAKPIEAGGTVRFSIPAEVEGRFELEMEESAVPIARIEVLP